MMNLNLPPHPSTIQFGPDLFSSLVNYIDTDMLIEYKVVTGRPFSASAITNIRLSVA